MGFISYYRVECRGKNTYRVKEQLKELGLRWNSKKQCWFGRIPDDDFYELRRLAERYRLELDWVDEYDEYLREMASINSSRKKYARTSNTSPVRCLECGRLLPPGYAVRDGGGWSCADGCEKYTYDFLRQELIKQGYGHLVGGGQSNG